VKKDRPKSKHSIIDGLRDVDKLGGIPRQELQQTFCCKASQPLNEPVIPYLSTHKFPIIKW